MDGEVERETVRGDKAAPLSLFPSYYLCKVGLEGGRGGEGRGEGGARGRGGGGSRWGGAGFGRIVRAWRCHSQGLSPFFLSAIQARAHVRGGRLAHSKEEGACRVRGRARAEMEEWERARLAPLLLTTFFRQHLPLPPLFTRPSPPHTHSPHHHGRPRPGRRPVRSARRHQQDQGEGEKRRESGKRKRARAAAGVSFCAPAAQGPRAPSGAAHSSRQGRPDRWRTPEDEIESPTRPPRPAPPLKPRPSPPDHPSLTARILVFL